MLGLKKKPAPAAEPEDDEAAPAAPATPNARGKARDADDVDDDEEGGEAAATAPTKGKGGGILALLITLVVITIAGAGGGFMFGKMTSAKIEQTIGERITAKEKEAAEHPISTKYSGDMVLKEIEPIVTNLASPTDVWIRLETAMIFKNGALENPDVTAAEIRQDLVAYARTVSLAQLEGPSALQHLRDDLNERASLRTNGQVGELVIQTLVVQ